MHFRIKATALLTRVQHVFVRDGPSSVNRAFKADKKVALRKVHFLASYPTLFPNHLPHLTCVFRRLATTMNTLYILRIQNPLNEKPSSHRSSILWMV